MRKVKRKLIRLALIYLTSVFLKQYKRWRLCLDTAAAITITQYIRQSIIYLTILSVYYTLIMILIYL